MDLVKPKRAPEEEMERTQRILRRAHEKNKILQRELTLVQNQLEVKESEAKRLKRRVETLEKVAFLDPLTTLYNRRILTSILKREMSRATRIMRSYKKSRTFCVVLIDIDHFKAINDTYGHDIGDAVLVRFAAILKRNQREIDWMIRYGGEEFLMVLSDCDLAGAMLFLKRLQKKLDKHLEVETPLGSVKPTASFGLVEWSPQVVSPDVLLKKADEALYDAKISGRNRVCVAV